MMHHAGQRRGYRAMRKGTSVTEAAGGWETPIPGSYHIRDFIEEAGLNPVCRMYGFKGTGRDAQIQMHKGDLLLLGA
ncbi:protein STPG4-like [Coregonus clupeaformis]|uniref:protein STPG4-like n=1 Tax=Coregonus clupeaformis TaxID=59861 RepID=UPI001BE0D7E0|nr:protein STPG4-like [Coregonus clupeaformis]